MDEMNKNCDPLLGEAVVVWTGWGRTSWPVRDEQLVIERFGIDSAVVLLPLIKNLEDDFYSSGARFSVADLKEMGDVAAAQFREKHPEIPEDAVEALAWCYTFDYK